MKIDIYTDGAYNAKKDVGGYAYIVLSTISSNYFESYGYALHGNANRMELLAIVKAIKCVLVSYVYPNKELNIYTDSAYCLKPIEEGWIKVWNSCGWKAKKGTTIKNSDLWQELYEYLNNKNIKINIIKIKSHSNHEYNERADKLAKKGIETYLTKIEKAATKTTVDITVKHRSEYMEYYATTDERIKWEENIKQSITKAFPKEEYDVNISIQFIG